MPPELSTAMNMLFSEQPLNFLDALIRTVRAVLDRNPAVALTALAA
jgi:hypothetical protein